MKVNYTLTMYSEEEVVLFGNVWVNELTHNCHTDMQCCSTFVPSIVTCVNVVNESFAENIPALSLQTTQSE